MESYPPPAQARKGDCTLLADVPRNGFSAVRGLNSFSAACTAPWRPIKCCEEKGSDGDPLRAICALRSLSLVQKVRTAIPTSGPAIRIRARKLYISSCPSHCTVGLLSSLLNQMSSACAAPGGNGGGDQPPRKGGGGDQGFRSLKNKLDRLRYKLRNARAFQVCGGAWVRRVGTALGFGPQMDLDGPSAKNAQKESVSGEIDPARRLQGLGSVPDPVGPRNMVAEANCPGFGLLPANGKMDSGMSLGIANLGLAPDWKSGPLDTVAVSDPMGNASG